MAAVICPQSTAGLNQTMRVVMILAAMAWAAQLLLCQWVHADELTDRRTQNENVGVERERNAPNEPSEKFVPAARRSNSSATLELRGEATVIGGEVTLKQICRWAESDSAAFEPLADLVVVRLGDKTPFHSITLKEIKSVLNDAGANLAMIRFAGTTSCTIARSDVQGESKADLRAWVEARGKETKTPVDLTGKSGNFKPVDTRTVDTKGANKSGTGSTAAITAKPDSNSKNSVVPDVKNLISPREMYSAGTPDKTVVSSGSGKVVAKESDAIAASSRIGSKKVEAPPEPVVDHRTLRQLLLVDLAERLSIDPNSLQMHFNPTDEKTLALAEPYFRFKIDSNRAKSLGDIVWDVTVVSNGGTMKGTIEANARAWQEQLKAIKPMAYHQTIQNEDIADVRTLVDFLGNDPQIKREQVVGQWASHEIKAGTILTTRMIDAAPMVRSGQLITVTSEHGNIKVTAVGRAVESGSFGETIKVKNETTGDVYEATLTGPQAARIGVVNSSRTTERSRTATIGN